VLVLRTCVVAARKPIERQEARRLRSEQGTPLKQIAARLGVSVSTTHLWTKDIELTPEQYQAQGRRRAREGDELHRAGCMLYWAEGAKDRNTVVFVNSDRPMVEYFVRFLRESLGVTSAEITVRLNVYLTNGLTLREVEDHWLWALGLPRSSLRKHTINHAPTSSSGQRRDKLPYGVCAIRVKRSTRLVQHIYGAIQEYAGFDERRWLDGPPRKRRSEPAEELSSPSGTKTTSRRQRGAR